MGRNTGGMQFGLGAFIGVIVLLMLLSVVAFQFLRNRKAAEWEARYEAEVRYHEQTIQIKYAENAALELELENVRTYVDILEAKIDQLKLEMGQARKPKDPDD